MPRHCGYFADVNFGIEIGGESLTMIAAVAIKNVERVNPFKMMFLEVRRKNAGHAGVKAGAEQRHQPCGLEAFLIRPLPMIFELCDIERFVIRGIHVIHAGGQTRIHDMQVLIGQSEIDDQSRLDLVQQSGGRGNVIGVNLIGVDANAGPLLDRCGNGIAFRFSPACKADMAKYVRVHCHFMHSNRPNAACTNYQNPAHLLLALQEIR